MPGESESGRMRHIARCGLVRATLLLASGVLVMSCGSTSVTNLGASAPPTVTLIPLATATATALLPPTATGARSETTCLPDDYGIYSSQTTYITSLDNFDLPAPPKTKHGIGSAGTNSNGTQGGASGLCTIGTQATVDSFYDTQLPALGWSYSTPPATVAQKCLANGAPWTGVQWWKGNDLFSWAGAGDAGGGSVFWSYIFCIAS